MGMPKEGKLYGLSRDLTDSRVWSINTFKVNLSITITISACSPLLDASVSSSVAISIFSVGVRVMKVHLHVVNMSY